MKILLKLLLLLNLTICEAQVVKCNYFLQNENPQVSHGIQGSYFSNLKGNILNYTQYVYKPINEEVNEFKMFGGLNNYTFHFNEIGQVVKRTSYHASGESKSELFYIDYFHDKISHRVIYNSKDEIIRRTDLTYENDIYIGSSQTENDSIEVSMFYVYESGDTTLVKKDRTLFTYINNKLYEWKSYKDNGKSTSHKYFYYPSGLYKKTLGLKNDKLETIKTYNENGFQESYEILYLGDSWEYKYDKRNLLVTKTERKKRGRFTTVTKYTYNEDGYLIGSTESEFKGEIEINFNKINNYAYNEMGDLVIEDLWFQKIEYKNYKYDHLQNWIYRERFKNDKLDRVYMRTFNYFVK